jgi:acetylornithine/succinyldiaminopimelate/putrescine aminotransferase
LLFAKSLGNGFPVAALALRDPVTVPAEALPGSTFSANAMALAAAQATLEAIRQLPISDQVANIEATVQAMRSSLAQAGAVLRGRGALWCVEFSDAQRCRHVHADLRLAGVLLSRTDRAIRLVPAANIAPTLLADVCHKIIRACQTHRP